MIVDWYYRHGYHFLALTDHNDFSRGQKWVRVSQMNRRGSHDAFERYLKRFGNEWIETRTLDHDLQVRLKPLNECRFLFEQAGRFLMLQGEEITDHFEAKPVHVNACNLLEPIKPQRGKSVVETLTNDLAAVEEQARHTGRSILAHVNHPNYGYAITAEELAMTTKARLFELYNGLPDVHHRGDPTHVGIERMWDIANTIRIGEMHAPPIFGLGVDDAHHYHGRGIASPGRGWIMVRARHLTPQTIIKAIEAGDFYASSGVTLRSLRYTPESKVLELEIEPDGDASYETQFIGTTKGYDPTRTPVKSDDGKPLPVTQRYSEDVGRVLATSDGTTARYQLTGNELYVRAVVTSSRPLRNPSFPGQKAQAWTQPVGWERQSPTVEASSASRRP
jgi:hypothetical protein